MSVPIPNQAQLPGTSTGPRRFPRQQINVTQPGRAGPRLTLRWGRGVGLGVSPTFSRSDASELQCDCKCVREPRHHKGAEATASKAPTPTLHAHAAPRVKELSLTTQDLQGWNFPVSQSRLPRGG